MIFTTIEEYEIGSTPVEENCIQVRHRRPMVHNTEDYIPAMREECQRYKTLLEKRFTNIPNGMRFKIKRFPHDFGSYYEVCVVYDTEDEYHNEVFLFIDGHLPMQWTDKEVFDVESEVKL